MGRSILMVMNKEINDSGNNTDIKTINRLSFKEILDGCDIEAKMK